MAGLDSEPIVLREERHDGMATCRLCSSTDAAAEHEWCAATRALVCGACCRRLLAGDIRRIPTRDLDGRAGDIVSACLGCERGRRWFADQLLGSFGGGEPC